MYLMRNVQGSGDQAGYQVFDVTNVTAPVLVGAVYGPAQHPQGVVGVQVGHRLRAGQPRAVLQRAAVATSRAC